MIIRSEPLKPNINAMNAIMVEYFANTVGHKDTPPLDYDWPFYLQAEADGKYVLITARENDELIGYVDYYVNTHPHHKTVMFASCNTLATKLGHRGKGVGTKLVKAAEPLLQLYNVDCIVHGYRTVYDTEPLFPKLGFKLIEQIYVKVL